MPTLGGSFFVEGIPISKPRMTKSDVWKKRACVIEYRAWADVLRARILGNPDQSSKLPPDGCYSLTLNFFLPIPPSTSPKKRETMTGKPCTVRPDIDNLSKGVMDAIFSRDSNVTELHATKTYEVAGKIGVLVTLESA
jgi:Holliday junction resolvase RusA-like endonuclease